MLVDRKIQLVQKKTSMTLKQLDATLQIKDRQNNVSKSVTQKCAQINDAIPGFLGISKAILENVVFVHQEESNWPLGEPKELKAKLDDIFATTRYNKALDEIGKQKKAKKDVAKNRKG